MTRSAGNVLRERFILALIIFGASLLWGVSFTGWLLLEKFLNHKIPAAMFISGFVAATFIYACMESGLNIKKIGSFFIRHQWWIIFLFFVAYSIVMSLVSLWRHLAFETYAFDLAIFDQAIWSTLRGKFLFSSLKGNICLLGDHMSPILLLFVPLYALWADARVLLIAQAIVTALCFFPVGLLAQEKFGKGIIPILFAFAFYLYLPLRHSVRAEFHPELLANLFAFAAFYLMIKRRWALFFIVLILLVFCKENMYGVTFMFGFFLLLEKHWRKGFFIAVLSVLFFMLTTQIVIPFFSGGKYFYQANYAYLFSGNWGSSPPLIVQPSGILEYLAKIYFPLGFLSFFHWPTLLLTFPILFQNLLSRNPFMHSIAFQYTSGLTPFVFISAIYGYRALIQRFRKRWRRRLEILCAVIILFGSLISAGRPEHHYSFKYKTGLDSRYISIRKLLHSIPESLSVIANDNLVPHLSHRLHIRQFEDYQRMPLSAVYPLEADLVILGERWTEGNIENEVTKVEDSGYRLLLERDGLFILARKSKGHDKTI